MPRKRKHSEATASEPELTEETQFTAMVVAIAVRNAMEDFHCQHLSDTQMRELNPIVRNAICTALYAMKNYAVSEKAKIYLDFHARSIPDYWEQPEIAAYFSKKHQVDLESLME